MKSKLMSYIEYSAINNRLGIVISGPSGSGKTSITNAILKNDPNIKLSISVTTRPPRPFEVDGVNYLFRSREEFEQMHKDGAFLETAQIYGNLYGTPRDYVYKVFEEGSDVVFDVNFAGACSIKQNLKQRTISIFIMPPSLEVLKERLDRRGENDPASINARLDSSEEEMKDAKYYDYVIINDKLNEALEQVQSIIYNARKC